MIIGDYKNSQNKKRNAILNPDYKNIAINSKFIGDKFVSYFTFSKWDIFLIAFKHKYNKFYFLFYL